MLSPLLKQENESFLAPIRNASHIFLYHLSIHKRIEKGRDDVWKHTLRAVEYGRYLLSHEEGEEEIVIPALYVHDNGWSSVNFDDFREASPGRKSKAVSLSLHMKYGAVLAREILEDLGFHPQKTHTIVSIIAIYDEPDKVFATKDPSATLIVEADRMDRYGPQSISRFTAMDGENYLRGDQWKKAATYLREAAAYPMSHLENLTGTAVLLGTIMEDQLVCMDKHE